MLDEFYCIAPKDCSIPCNTPASAAISRQPLKLPRSTDNNVCFYAAGSRKDQKYRQKYDNLHSGLGLQSAARGCKNTPTGVPKHVNH